MIEEKEGLLCMTMCLFSVWVDRENQAIGEGPEIVERVKTIIMYYVPHVGIGKNPTILKEISHLHFPRLQELMLNDNGIGSVEGIYRISMPHLQEIELSTPCHE